jgi:hypothetical protein
VGREERKMGKVGEWEGGRINSYREKSERKERLGEERGIPFGTYLSISAK